MLLAVPELVRLDQDRVSDRLQDQDVAIDALLILGQQLVVVGDEQDFLREAHQRLAQADFGPLPLARHLVLGAVEGLPRGFLHVPFDQRLDALGQASAFETNRGTFRELPGRLANAFNDFLLIFNFQ